MNRHYKFEIRKAVNDQYYFVMIANNTLIIATSETYHNLKDCQDTIKSIQENAKGSTTHIAFK